MRNFSSASFKASDISVEKSTTHKTKPPSGHSYVFGELKTDHMLEIDWSEADGWKAPRIRPYGPLEIYPSNITLHYATECFDGLKAYPHVNGNTINLFRPDMNMERFITSCRYASLPTFDPTELVGCVKHLLKVDRDWMPARLDHALYLRMAAISTENFLGVRHPKSTKLFAFLSPTGNYTEKQKAASGYANTHFHRAYKHGFGDKMLGANFAPTILQ